MGFLSCLSLLLVAAKLFGFAHYSWLIAFSPLILSVGIMLVVMGCAVAVAIIEAR